MSNRKIKTEICVTVGDKKLTLISENIVILESTSESAPTTKVILGKDTLKAMIDAVDELADAYTDDFGWDSLYEKDSEED